MSNKQIADSIVSELDRVQLDTWPESNQMVFAVF